MGLRLRAVYHQPRHTTKKSASLVDAQLVLSMCEGAFVSIGAVALPEVLAHLRLVLRGGVAMLVHEPTLHSLLAVASLVEDADRLAGRPRRTPTTLAAITPPVVTIELR